MGCDIHIVLERRKKAGGKWIGVYATDTHPGRRILIAQRDYDFFAQVASVRGSGPNYPRNVPEDISALAWEQYMRCPTDHHSASHMTIAEFTKAWLAVHPPGQRGEIREEWAAYELLGVDGGEDDFDHRVVFWFDN